MKNNEKLHEKLNHLPVFGWAVVFLSSAWKNPFFACPVLGRKESSWYGWNHSFGSVVSSDSYCVFCVSLSDCWDHPGQFCTRPHTSHLVHYLWWPHSRCQEVSLFFAPPHPPTPRPPPQPTATTTHFVSFAVIQVLCLLCHRDFLMGERSALIVFFC